MPLTTVHTFAQQRNLSDPTALKRLRALCRKGYAQWRHHTIYWILPQDTGSPSHPLAYRSWRAI